ncbi:MAG: type II CAAX endopeptidase family protein [Acidobacteriota bacterium]
MNPRPEPSDILLRTGAFLFAALVLWFAVPSALIQVDLVTMSAFTTLLAGLAANYSSAYWFEQGRWSDFGLGWSRSSGRDLGGGFLLGVGAIAILAMGALATGAATIEAAYPLPSTPVAALPALLFLGALGEELLFHGYLFQYMTRIWNPAAVIIGVGIVFGLLHLLSNGATPIGTLNTALWGGVMGLACWRTQALWLPAGIHFGWNLGLVLLGEPLSGIKIGGNGLSPRVARGRTVEWWDVRSGSRIAGDWIGGRVVLGPEAQEIIMKRLVVNIAGLLLAAAVAQADTHKLTDEQKRELVRGLTAEWAKAKIELPVSKKPLPFDSIGARDEEFWKDALYKNGPAARPGDMVQITKIDVDDDKIKVELNDGSKKGRFLDHVQISGSGGTMTGPPKAGPTSAAAGTSIEIRFPKSIGEIDSAGVKKILSSIMDFNIHTAVETYIESLPEPVREAIKAKKAIVGMDREQVLMALARRSVNRERPKKTLTTRIGSTASSRASSGLSRSRAPRWTTSKSFMWA